ncbi:MAG TPA: sigma factor, partial [Ktedonobacterales bacterium]
MRERSLGDLELMDMSLTLAAFTATVDQRQAPLYAFLRGLLGDAEQARDLTQDAFQDAWRATQSVSPPWTAAHDDDERRRWLFRAAYHRALTQLRRRKIIRWASLDWPGSGERDASGPERIE